MSNFVNSYFSNGLRFTKPPTRWVSRVTKAATGKFFPKGTAKSLLARRLALVCKGQFFERLLTRFSVPEEVGSEEVGWQKAEKHVVL